MSEGLNTMFESDLIKQTEDMITQPIVFVTF